MKIAPLLLAALTPTAALAQQHLPTDTAPAAPLAGADGSGDAPAVATPAATASEAPDAHHFDRINALGIKGWDTPFPRASDTMLADIGGIRSTLADAGIGVLAFSLNSGVYNFRHDDTPGASYNGRRPTYFAGNQALYVTFDTGRIGLAGGQLQLQAGVNTNGLNALDGPRFARIGNLAYFQQLWNDTIEFKIGYFSMAPEFVGTQVAGSLVAGTLGPQAGIPVQLGFAYGGLGAPAADIRFNGGNGFYAKAGVQRSFPRGGIQQVIAGDSVGLRFSYPDTNALFVGELGIKRPAAPGQKSFWIRGGGIYNTTTITNYYTGGTAQNWAGFLGVDRQLTQPDQRQPFRGLYVGSSVNYAPPHQNLYTQYYEGRIYDIGVFPGRPSDLATMVVSYNKLSTLALDARFPGRQAQDYAFSAIASYSYRLIRGLYLQPGVGVVKNPLPAPKVPLTLNGYLTLSFLL